MAVRAKFRVQRVSRHDYGWGDQVEVTLGPVVSSDPNSENKAFWEKTPAGEIRLTTVNETAAAQFEPGAEFYVDFTRAD